MSNRGGGGAAGVGQGADTMMKDENSARSCELLLHRTFSWAFLIFLRKKKSKKNLSKSKEGGAEAFCCHTRKKDRAPCHVTTSMLLRDRFLRFNVKLSGHFAIRFLKFLCEKRRIFT